MSESSSFNSEQLSDECLEDEDTKSQTDKEKEKEKAIASLQDSIEIENLDLINSISNTLITILEKNKQLSNYKDILKNQSKMYFSSYTIPTITIKEYLIRIQIYSGVEYSTLILSLILIDKMCKRSGILLTYFNIHRILFSSLLISIKELQLLEYTFLEYNDFNVFVKDYEYIQYEKYLIPKIHDK